MSERSSDFFKSSSIQSSDKRIEASQISMALLECKTSAQVGKGLTCVSFVQRSFSLFASLATAQTWPEKRSQSA